MEWYTVNQRIIIIQTYYENLRSIKSTHRKLRDEFGQHGRPTELTIRRLVKKFEETGSVQDIKHTQYPRRARSEENIAAVRESVEADPRLSISRRAMR